MYGVPHRSAKLRRREATGTQSTSEHEGRRGAEPEEGLARCDRGGKAGYRRTSDGCLVIFLSNRGGRPCGAPTPPAGYTVNVMASVPSVRACRIRPQRYRYRPGSGRNSHLTPVLLSAACERLDAGIVIGPPQSGKQTPILTCPWSATAPQSFGEKGKRRCACDGYCQGSVADPRI